MKKFVLRVLVPAGFCAVACAQQWEVGAMGGAGFLNHVSVSGSAGSATAGFAPGVTGSVFFGQNLYSNLSGKIQYDIFQSNLKLSGDGSSASFTGLAHAVHYDLAWHTRRPESASQFFVAVGGGMKIFQGLGTPEAYQPLMQFGYFTKTHQVEPMGTVATGLTHRLGPHVLFRVELRDYISPFPKSVLTPAPGTKYGSILNDIVPMAGISYVF